MNKKDRKKYEQLMRDAKMYFNSAEEHMDYVDAEDEEAYELLDTVIDDLETASGYVKQAQNLLDE